MSDCERLPPVSFGGPSQSMFAIYASQPRTCYGCRISSWYLWQFLKQLLLAFNPCETSWSDKFSNLLNLMNRSTFRWIIDLLWDWSSPQPQDSSGTRAEIAARQNADTLEVGVAWSIIDGFWETAPSLLPITGVLQLVAPLNSWVSKAVNGVAVSSVFTSGQCVGPFIT